MNDRFKFRVWNKARKGYIEPPEPTPLLQADGLLAYFTNHPEYMENYDVQFCTGLKDKNGTLIYEGDIFYKKGTKNLQGKKINSTVIWDRMYAQFNISDENGFHRLPSNSKNIEVIGNRYENPELLQEHK